MNFLEALASKQPFRRPCFGKDWYWWDQDGRMVAGKYPDVHELYKDGINPNTFHLLMGDYQLRKPDAPVILTMSQFWQAVARVEKNYKCLEPFDGWAITQLSIELGLFK